MKVIGIVGSPRKRMNTDVLVQAILDGCKRRGAHTEKVYLNDLDIKPCQACRVQDGNGCTLSTLSRRASLVTVGCEALGTSVSLTLRGGMAYAKFTGALGSMKGGLLAYLGVSRGIGPLASSCLETPARGSPQLVGGNFACRVDEPEQVRDSDAPL